MEQQEYGKNIVKRWKLKISRGQKMSKDRGVDVL